MLVKILGHPLLNLPGLHFRQSLHWILLIIQLIDDLAKTKPLRPFTVMQYRIARVVHVFQVGGFGVVGVDLAGMLALDVEEHVFVDLLGVHEEDAEGGGFGGRVAVGGEGLLEGFEGLE